MEPDFPPVIAIVGQTAVGKSALALSLSELFQGEIVTADSRQVYKYMDIGTDKPSAEERRRVPHHLIDLIDPDAPFTVADYQDLAFSAIKDISGRGRIPVVAGGSPLYANAVLDGWTIPRVGPNEELRKELEAEAATHGPSLLHERLRQVDPKSAASILPSNTRRLVRALEVVLRTGEPISDQQNRLAPPLRILRLGLKCERSILYRRIDDRVDQQIERGLVVEVQDLHERGYGFDLRSMSGIGYRQIGEYLQGKTTLPDAVQRIKWDTHNFARHQANWFKREASTTWLDVTDADPLPRAIALVAGHLGG